MPPNIMLRLWCGGVVQKDHGAINVLALRFRGLSGLPTQPAFDCGLQYPNGIGRRGGIARGTARPEEAV